MDYILNTLINLAEASGLNQITYKNVIMIAVACGLLYLAIKKDYEPLLLIPIAFGMLLVNLFPAIMAEPTYTANGDYSPGGLLYYFYLGDEYG
ncbi:MAG: glutaconyl-CoA decarboxylase subunit beta, partial [Clostridiales bacterium]|nr:glutaconyl-CoA decarboxylase subunit beta [Clostridiales bacterium]